MVGINMHRLLKLGDKSKYWSPQLNSTLVRCCAPFRRILQRRQQKVLDIKFEGLDNLRGVLDGIDGSFIFESISRKNKQRIVIYYGALIYER